MEVITDSVRLVLLVDPTTTILDEAVAFSEVEGVFGRVVNCFVLTTAEEAVVLRFASRLALLTEVKVALALAVERTLPIEDTEPLLVESIGTILLAKSSAIVPLVYVMRVVLVV